MKENQFSIQSVLSFFSGLCAAGAFSLLFCFQSFSAHPPAEHSSTYISGSFLNDVAAVYRCVRNFSGSKTIILGGNSAESLPNNGFVDLISLLPAHKGQMFYSGFNLNCEFITCSSPPRAGPGAL